MGTCSAGSNGGDTEGVDHRVHTSDEEPQHGPKPSLLPSSSGERGPPSPSSDVGLPGARLGKPGYLEAQDPPHPGKVSGRSA
jgi:hypothetical protein